VSERQPGFPYSSSADSYGAFRSLGLRFGRPLRYDGPAIFTSAGDIRAEEDAEDAESAWHCVEERLIEQPEQCQERACKSHVNDSELQT
jgi:hypothetical protein